MEQLKISEQVTWLLRALFHGVPGEGVLRVGKGVAAQEAAFRFSGEDWPARLLKEFEFDPTDELKFASLTYDGRAPRAARVLWAELQRQGAEPPKLDLQPTAVLEDVNSWFPLYALDRPLEDLAKLEAAQLALARRVGGYSGTISDVVPMGPGAFGNEARVTELLACSPLRRALRVPGSHVRTLHDGQPHRARLHAVMGKVYGFDELSAAVAAQEVKR
jgi:hypothetical protein